MRQLKKAWKIWMKIAKPIGNFQARVIFTLFYFLLLGFIGIPMRLFSDPLRVQRNKKIRSMFSDWEYPEEGIEEARRPF